MTGIQENSMLRLDDSLKEFRERVNVLQLNNPLKQVTDAISVQLRERIGCIQETVNTQIQESLKRQRNAINAYQLDDPLQEYREKINALKLINPFKRMSIQISDQLQEQVSSFQEAINAQIQDSLQQFRDGIQVALRYDSANGVATIHSLVRDINTNDQNFVSLGKTTVDFAQVQIIATQILTTASNASNHQSTQAFTETIIAEIRAQKDEPIKQFLIYLIYPLLVGMILLVIEPNIKDWSGVDKRKTEKQIKKQVLSTTQDATQLDSYRLVSANTLAVRLKPSAKSACLERINFGQIVVLVEKRGDWSLVSWADDTKGLAHQGWVFSRYLSKFR